GGRGRAASPGARAPHALGAAHGLELIAGDPARRRGAVRRASLLLTPGLTAGARPPCAGTLREGVVASLALVPSVFVYGTVFGGLAVQAGLTVAQVLGMCVLVFAGASQFVAGPVLPPPPPPAPPPPAPPLPY